MDEYEVRSYKGWYRHMTLAMMAHSILCISRKFFPIQGKSFFFIDFKKKSRPFVRVVFRRLAPINKPLKSIENRIEEKIKDKFILSLLWVFLFGFLTSLTPCVYPLIPITFAVLGDVKKNHGGNLS